MRARTTPVSVFHDTEDNNDPEDNMESAVRLFADNTIFYVAVSSTQYAETLQNDLNKLGIQERKWHMKFHQGSPHNNQEEETYSVQIHTA